jgi:hypothetical protein
MDGINSLSGTPSDVTVRSKKKPFSEPPSAPETAGDSVHIEGATRKRTKKGSTSSKGTAAAQTSFDNQPSPSPSAEKPLLFAPIDVAARKIHIEDMISTKEQLEKGTLKGEAFGAAADRMAEYAQDRSDPLISRMARSLLDDYVDFGTPEVNWMMKVGIVDGPVKYLASMGRHLDDKGHGGYLSDKCRFPEFLKALARGTAGAPVPQEALKTVAHLGNKFALRSAADMPPEIRKHEPAEKDLYWGAGCASLVDFWWNNGQIEVRRDGEVIKPGSMDLRELLVTQRVAVRGSAIELQGPSPKHGIKEKRLADEVMKGIDPHGDYEKRAKEDKGVETLHELYENDPSTAEKVMEIIIEGAEASMGGREEGKELPRWGVPSLSRMLFHARDKEWLRELMKDHLPALRDIPQKAHSYGMLSEDNPMGESYVKFSRNLVKAFPETLDADFIRDGLSLMLDSDEINTRESAGKLARDLWKERPELVSPTMEAMLKDTARPYLDDDQWSLITEAVEKYDWVPEKPLVDRLASRLFLPPGRKKESLFDGSGLKGYDLGGGIKFLTALLKKNPELVRGPELPDARGKLVPLDSALIDRIVNDPGGSDVLRHLYTRGSMDNDYHGRTKALYDLVRTDKPLLEDMMKKVREEYGRAGSIDGMSRAEKGMLTMLYCLDLNEVGAAQLREIFMKDMGNRQGFYVFTDMVDRVRREEIQGANEDLKKGELSPEAHLERTRGAIAIAHNLGISSDLGWNSGRTFEAMEEGQKAGKIDLKPPLPGLLKEFDGSLAKNGTVGAMSPRDLALLQILEHLSRTDGELKGKMAEILRPHLAVDQGYGNGVAVDCLDPFRKMEIERQGDTLASGSLTRTERMTIHDKILAIGKTSYNFKEDETRGGALSQFTKGLAASGASTPLEDLPKAFTDPANAYKAYCGFMPGAEKNSECAVEWVKLKDIMDRLGGEAQLDLALDTYHFVEEMASKGMAREKALAHALRSRSLGSDPRKVPMEDDKGPGGSQEVNVEEEFVDIGGMKLDISKDKS